MNMLYVLLFVSPLVMAQDNLTSLTKKDFHCNIISNVVGEYKHINAHQVKATMIVYPDDLKNRIRYAFRYDDGFTSIYEVAYHVKGCTYKVISNDKNYITFSGNLLEYHHAGTPEWKESYKKEE